jgi:hypothetical protein
MGMRGQYKNKRDGNEGPIVDAFRKHGCTVERMDQPMDLLVGYRGTTRLVEVKLEGKGLNEKQEKWADNWRGDLTIVRSVEDVEETVREWQSPWRSIGDIAASMVRGQVE